jgi:hypothetical protein
LGAGDLFRVWPRRIKLHKLGQMAPVVCGKASTMVCTHESGQGPTREGPTESELQAKLDAARMRLREIVILGMKIWRPTDTTVALGRTLQPQIPTAPDWPPFGGFDVAGNTSGCAINRPTQSGRRRINGEGVPLDPELVQLKRRRSRAVFRRQLDRSEKGQVRQAQSHRPGQTSPPCRGQKLYPSPLRRPTVT